MNVYELICVSYNINIDEYLTFAKEVRESMQYPEWLGTFDKEYLISKLQEGYKIWLYYLDKEPVCSMMLIPTTEESIIKIGLTQYNYKEAVDYGPIMVNKKYISNKLQYQMLKKLDEYSLKHGYKYALATIHPDNKYSINNFIKDNFTKIGIKEFKRGIREIYLKQLN